MKKTLVGLSLFLFVAFVYYRSPVHYLSDGSYSFLMDEAILHHGTPNMLAYQVPRGGPPYYINPGGYLWTIEVVNGRLLYVFPWGVALLSLPAVAVLNAAGVSVAPHGSYNQDNELKMQVIVTTLLCAALVWLFFDTAALSLPLGCAFTIALATAFGTQIWSTISRNLWPQTWSLVLVSAAVWLLIKGRPRPIVLGTLLAWACFTRYPELPTALMIGVYLLIEYGWRRSLAYAATGAAWAVVFGGVMLVFFGRLSALEYQEGLDFPREFFYRVAGILISPSRGLLVFVPIVLMPVYLTIRYRRVLMHRRLALLAIAAITSHVVLIASWPYWWGDGYGPRGLADTIPWFLLLAILGVKAFLNDSRLTVPAGAAIVSVGLLLLILSVAMNTAGAMSWTAEEWENHPSVNANPQRLWDWQHPQFLAWAQGG